MAGKVLKIYAWLLLSMLAPVLHAGGQVMQRDPSIGFVYPAGGRQGSVIQITVGGQYLRGARKAFFTAPGITVKNIVHVPPLNNQQMQELQRRIGVIRRDRQAALRQPPAAAQPEGAKASPPAAPAAEPARKEPPPLMVTLPDHPLLRNLEKLSNEELRQTAAMFITRNRLQPPKRSIQELVVMDVEIPAGTPPQDGELRLWGPSGLTNPLRFQIGSLPEVIEKEPNDRNDAGGKVLALPLLLNGQIMPGDADRFRFLANQGQRLVIEAHARRLVPYMADAVPGWFQAVLTLFDAAGREIACVDDYRTGPDPVLLFEVPADGEYVLEIRDALYRGREDFVYRLSISEKPFVTRLFPLGGRSGMPLTAGVAGWNLAENRLLLDTAPGPEAVRETFLFRNGERSNPVRFAVDDLPESLEKEPNDTLRNAEKMKLPLIINGRIGQAGDVDVFQFQGRAGEEIRAETFARRLDSPLDALLRLQDATGKVLAWNDDTEDRGSGLNTHHADAYIRRKLPADGRYYLQLTDAQRQGGPEYTYRLRMGQAAPDFALRLTPSAINLTLGGITPIRVYALRRDGFSGDIELALQKAPEGFSLHGGLIPAGRERVRVTLQAPARMAAGPVPLEVVGRAHIGGEVLSRPAVAAEDMMQAFDYRHLVPVSGLMASVQGGGQRMNGVEAAESLPVKLPAGGSVRVRFKVPTSLTLTAPRMELSEAPAGISLAGMQLKDGELILELKAAAGTVPPGYADNLIVELFAERPFGPKDAVVMRQTFVGYLPAIPFIVTEN